MTLDEANALAHADFVAAFGGVFEHSPWVAERVAEQRPFASRQALHQAMCAEVRSVDRETHLELLRAHPELAASRVGMLTASSASEQQGAGLTELDEARAAQFHTQNELYRIRFGFPFIIAVRGLTPNAILHAFAQRQQRTVEEEFAEAMRQVERIAQLRLEALVTNP
jgi:2-oxo-4-hydroxy-4-carboxy-5-ureidoimidazoline decarboxylase